MRLLSPIEDLPMIKVQDNSLLHLLPYSLREDPVVVAMAEAAEIQLKEAYREAEILFNLVEIEKVPEQLLDLLSYEKHVDFYDVSLPIEQKQEVIKASISQHRKKGTPEAVEKALSAISVENRLLEWFEYNGSPFFFSTLLNLESSPDRIQMKKIINATKNTRSWFDKFIFKGNFLIVSQFNNKLLIRAKLSTASIPWAQAGMGSIGEITRLDGEYLLNGDRFLNGFYNKDGPAHLQRIKLAMKVLHGFGAHEVNILPSLDGEFNLDGEIKLQNEPQNIRLVSLHGAKMRYKKREYIHVIHNQSAPVICSTSAMNGVVTLNGQVQLDSSISLDQALSNHSGLFRVKKAGSIIEEVAI